VVSGLTVNRDDVIRITTANGGGYGDPRERDRSAVTDDLRNGYVTAEQAAGEYGYTA
jgi:N-methylhydantoinase B